MRVSVGWIGLLLISSLEARPPVVPGAEAGGSLDGRVLVDALNCTACHDIEGFEPVAALSAPIFQQSMGSRYTLEELQKWIANPHEIKPGTRMPDLFGESNPAESEAEAIAHFLMSLPAVFSGESFPMGDVEAGRKLYHTIGCVACHAPGAGDEPGADAAGPLGTESIPIRLARLWPTDVVADYLRHPTTPGMPDFALSREEAADLAAYLHRDTVQEATEFYRRESGLVARGSGLFSSRGCAKCHGSPKGVLAMGRKIRRKLTPALLEQGCLAEEPGGRAPDFFLSKAQREAIRSALREDDPSVRDPVGHTMQTLNCTACHERGGVGGVPPGRRPHFGVSDERALALGEDARLPPELDGVGRKLRIDWLERVLRGDPETNLRSASLVRMPWVEHPAVARLADRLVEADVAGEAERWQPPEETGPAAIEAGRHLMSSEGLGCVACHGFGGEPALATPSIDLNHTGERLRPGYFHDILLEPQQTDPGTAMPPLFDGRPEAEMEVSRIWQYLVAEGGGKQDGAE